MSSSLLTQFPGQALPGDLTGMTVAALEAKTAPLPTTVSPTTKYYFCPVPNTSMFRPDGMRLIFIQGVHETNILASQDYLDCEISGRDFKTRQPTNDPHPFLTEATPEQVQRYRMHVNPRKTIADELTPQIEERMRDKLESELIARLQSKGVEGAADIVRMAGVERPVDTRERVQSGTGKVAPPLPLSSLEDRSSFQRSAVGSDKLAGAEAGSSSSSPSL